MTFERMWDGPKPPRANLSRPAETVMHILHAPEPLKADLSKLLILRTCGMAHSYYSLAWQGYTCGVAKSTRIALVKNIMQSYREYA